MKLTEITNTSQFLTDPSEIKHWLRDHGVDLKHSIINVSENGNVYSAGADIILNPAIPVKQLPIKFKKTHSEFDCTDIGLESLKGCPDFVYGNFYCGGNKLTSLVDGPTTVSGNYSIGSNKLLTSLEGAPYSLSGDFICSGNKSLTSLYGAPKSVGGLFTVNNCGLTSLVDFPSTVSGYIDCSNNQLTSLTGLCKYVYKDLNCSENPIESLEGIKLNTRGNVNLAKCSLTSLINISESIQSVNGHLNIMGNNITSGGLDLLSIKGLTEVFYTYGERYSLAFQIINQYLAKKGAMFECQEALINAGLDEFAQL